MEGVGRCTAKYLMFRVTFYLWLFVLGKQDSDSLDDQQIWCSQILLYNNLSCMTYCSHTKNVLASIITFLTSL